MDIDKLIARHGLISDQVDVAELRVILGELTRVIEKGVDGAVVEFGCYKGTTSLYLRRILDALAPDMPLHVYDSFEGLPEKTAKDTSPAGTHFVSGELRAGKKELLAEFHRANLRPPVVHKGWFNELTPDDVPEPVAFAFLDGDYYESVKAPLELLAGKLAPGAVIIVDDYANEALPGAARAADEWAIKKNITIRTVASLAIMKP